MRGLFEVDSKVTLKKYLIFTYSVNKQVVCKILLSLVDERVLVLIYTGEYECTASQSKPQKGYDAKDDKVSRTFIINLYFCCCFEYVDVYIILYEPLLVL